MSKTAKCVIGILVVIVVLQFFAPFLGQWIFPGAQPGYGMMGRGGFGYGTRMPMMGGGMGYGYGGFGFFGMLFMWLIPVGILALIVLGIAWLVKQLTAKPS